MAKRPSRKSSAKVKSAGKKSLRKASSADAPVGKSSAKVQSAGICAHEHNEATKPVTLAPWDANCRRQTGLSRVRRLHLLRTLSGNKLHKSFKRSYREDYLREFTPPGLLEHTFATFKMLFKEHHFRTFGPLILIMVIANVFLIGLMSEQTYTTFQETLDSTSSDIGVENINNFAKAGLLLVSTIATGGLTNGFGDTEQIFLVIIFLVIWLVTVYLVRHFLARKKIKLRDAFYNACAPIISTLIVLAVIFLQMIPIFIVIITYSTAVTTNFLATPFYALVYFVFASLMLILSGYWLSSSLIALVAVTAPGLRPFTALSTASDLMLGRRIKFIIRIIFLIFIIAFFFVIIVMPVILLDMWLKSSLDWTAGIPIVSVFLLITTCFSFVYSATYLYLYYRRMLDYEED
ncbi:hypothetical protein IJI91_00100 [Candidatus Saccharibacteria bacterium]|nr:hypothetical protein [Candidatus Saccharibacteria bacterium]